MNSTSTTEKTGENAEVHPLLARPIRAIETYTEWLTHWSKAETSDHMISLLHNGFTVPLWDRYGCNNTHTPTERILFYLSIADGWRDPDRILMHADDGKKEYCIGEDKHGNLKKESPSGLRCKVASKALVMLCQHFFKIEKQELYNQSRYDKARRELLLSEPLFSAIQHFFRIEETKFSRCRIRNLFLRDHEECSNNQVIIRDFLLDLAQMMWEWKGEDSFFLNDQEKMKETERNMQNRRRIEDAKPWMLEILDCFNQLSMMKKWMFSLAPACLSRLNEIALRAEIPSSYVSGVYGGGVYKVTTLAEACLAGSPAAEFLVLREISLKEYERLVKIKELKQKAQEAKRELDELAGTTVPA